MLSKTLATAWFRAALHLSELGIFLARLGASDTYASRRNRSHP